MREFTRIQRICDAFSNDDPSLIVAPGDDAAVITVPEGYELVVSSDMLVAAVHFFADADAADIGYKSLAVNLSDLAAMSAWPRWFSLSLSMPQNLPGVWLDGFISGIRQCATEQAPDISLIGGDLTGGPLAINITIQGLVPTGQAVLRSGAKPGDDIYVSGMLGAPALALKQWYKSGRGKPSFILQRLLRPQAQIELGYKLRNVVTSMLDISDGLIGDLTHMANASKVGMNIFQKQIPIFPDCINTRGFEPSMALVGGDEYQLAFCAPTNMYRQISSIAETLEIPITKIGKVTAGQNVVCLGENGEPVKLPKTGWQHF